MIILILSSELIPINTDQCIIIQKILYNDIPNLSWLQGTRLESSDQNKSDWHSWTNSGHIYKLLAGSNIYLSKEKDDGLEQTVIDLDEWGSVRIRYFVKL